MRTVLKEEAESVQVSLFICFFNKTFRINGKNNQVDI